MRVNLRKDDFEIISLAIFEYAGICDSEADISYETTGSNFKQDKKTSGYKLAKRLLKIHDKLEKEMRKQNE